MLVESITAERQGCEGEFISASEIIAAMSTALDLTEGQPTGHAARSCWIGMHLASQIGIGAEEKSALFYALLLKDLGCSSNASKVSYLFAADDRVVKREFKTVNWQSLWNNVRYVVSQVSPEGRTWDKLTRMLALAKQGPEGTKNLIKTRCERGAMIARRLGFSELTAQAILDLDEHWNGKGYPLGKKGHEISQLGRILNISQTIEVFWREMGLIAAKEVVKQRCGTWFEPALCRAFLRSCQERSLQRMMCCENLLTELVVFEPDQMRFSVDAAFLDRVAQGFSDVVDAKSPWTYKHSQGVAEISVGIARSIGWADDRIVSLRRAALLHDLGKLGISNRILDKPGKMTDEEFAIVKTHPRLTEEILSKVPALSELATVAGAHHERWDGRGYFRGIESSSLPLEARILMVADIFEALTAARPYRDGMPQEKVLAILEKDCGTAVCPEAYSGLLKWIDGRNVASRVEVQLEAVEKLLCGTGACS
ncbi:MAG: HD domain-containing protein [Planctomycetaceae bacterium]|nr:HD domain-containing protein [Planctomycetaceae bacterium]